MEQHLPVLVTEVMTGLAIVPDGLYIDGTFGRGGHSLAILAQLRECGKLLAIDKDAAAIKAGKEIHDKRFSIEQANFAEIERLAIERQWLGKVNGILLDLGVSSPQLDDPQRGFSFMREGPLDMRMNADVGQSAAKWLQVTQEQEIARVLYVYGEERYSRRIARAIVQARQKQAITSTTQLAQIVAQAVPYREQRKHPATRTFQAIRIFINNELEDLKKGLAQCLSVLKVGGRLCVISFHSLEDRVVKQFIQAGGQSQDVPMEIPLLAQQTERRLCKINGLILPSAAEIKNNNRARSARLRIAEKIA